jgi:HAD superfamily hydrolase (TIGR01549 family)
MPGPAHTSDLARATAGVRAVLFDVDGTLYRQRPLRRLMALEIALDAITGLSPARTAHVVRVLRTFRHTREDLRDQAASTEALEDMQYTAVARKLGIGADLVRQVVAEWILERPLKHMTRVRRPALDTLLQTLAAHALRIGALSDYPASGKLDALGVADYFSLALCTTDPAIDTFKPNPKGFLHACHLWGADPKDVLYVGDRPEVDAVGAAAAGMRCVIIGTDGPAPRPGCTAVVSSFGELAHGFTGAG